MRRASIAVSFLVCTPWLATPAQQAIVTPPPPALSLAGPLGSCPVELTAEQVHDGGFALARARSTTSHSQQVLDLSIRNPQSTRILSAQLEVHGTAPHARMLALQGATTPEAVADAVRPVRIDRSISTNQQQTQRVSLRDLTSVQWIDLVELTYADGSQWHAQPGRTCRVRPSLLERVAGSR